MLQGISFQIQYALSIELTTHRVHESILGSLLMLKIEYR